MRIHYLTATALIALAAAQTAAAVVYDGISFPQGDASFADAVLSYRPDFSGGNVPTDPKYVNPERATGVPNFVPDSGGSGGEFNGEGAVALGDGGRLELRFVDNVLTNTAGADLAIFERGVDEAFFVAVRPANATTRGLLGIQCPPTGFCALAGARTPVSDVVLIDLDAEFAGSFGAGDLRFDAVQVTDTSAQGATSGDQVGPDIDAVGAIGAGTIACGDSWVEGGEACDDAGTADGDGCSAGCQIELCWACTPGSEPSVCYANVGGPCDDGEPCTTADACGGPMGLTCIGGPPPDCEDGNICTDNSCVNGVGCTPTPNAAPCDDGSTCSSGDHCSGGACVGTAVELSGCHTAIGSTQIRIFNRLDDDTDGLIWTWPGGTGTPGSAFGDPINGAGSYELCVFDGPPGGRRLRATARADKGQSCGAASCWHEKATDRFLFKNPAAPFGMRQLYLKGGVDGRAKVLAKGRGQALNLSDDLTMTLPVRVELRDTNTGVCWQEAYPGAIRNDEERFKAKY